MLRTIYACSQLLISSRIRKCALPNAAAEQEKKAGTAVSLRCKRAARLDSGLAAQSRMNKVSAKPSLTCEALTALSKGRMIWAS